jgi:hypothetical protein
MPGPLSTNRTLLFWGFQVVAFCQKTRLRRSRQVQFSEPIGRNDFSRESQRDWKCGSLIAPKIWIHPQTSPAISSCTSISALGRSVVAVALEKTKRLHILSHPFSRLCVSNWSNGGEIGAHAVQLFQGWFYMVTSLVDISFEQIDISTFKSSDFHEKKVANIQRSPKYLKPIETVWENWGRSLDWRIPSQVLMRIV